MDHILVQGAFCFQSLNLTLLLKKSFHYHCILSIADLILVTNFGCNREDWSPVSIDKFLVYVQNSVNFMNFSEVIPMVSRAIHVPLISGVPSQNHQNEIKRRYGGSNQPKVKRIRWSLALPDLHRTATQKIPGLWQIDKKDTHQFLSSPKDWKARAGEYQESIPNPSQVHTDKLRVKQSPAQSDRLPWTHKPNWWRTAREDLFLPQWSYPSLPLLQ